MNRPVKRMRARLGFTLVELLVVIVIIGLLVSLVTGAAIAVRRTVRQTLILTEIQELQRALEDYKIEYGDYPPDFAFVNRNDYIGQAARQAVINHLRKAFPRYPLPAPDRSDPDPTQKPWNHFRNTVLANTIFDLPDGTKVAIDVNNLDPASALVFWLGGPPDPKSGSLLPAGFSEDPANPFRAGQPRKDPLFEFASDRFVFSESNPDGTRYLRYYPAGFTVPGGQSATPVDVTRERSPYVYFKARRESAAGARYEYAYATGRDPNNAEITPLYYRHGPGDSENVAVPYLEGDSSQPSLSDLLNPSNIRRWRDAKRFQIISAGLDGQFGSPTKPKHFFRFSKSGYNFCEDGADYDNLTNFAEGSLEDEMQ